MNGPDEGRTRVLLVAACVSDALATEPHRQLL